MCSEKQISAYGFDSYNQLCWEEVMPTLRSHGGGDTYPKCLVKKDELPKEDGIVDGE